MRSEVQSERPSFADPSAPVRIRRILCPCDFSDLSRRALQHAAALARWYDASLTALHVSPLPVPSLGGLPYYNPDPALYEPGLRRRLLIELGQQVREAGAADVPVDLAVEGGHPVAEILRQARELAADLLVIATHGRGGFERWVLGSVTEKLLRKAACPVLSVPPSVEGPAPPAAELFQRILCPVDFSAVSMHALKYALSLAEEADAELILVHVLESVEEDAASNEALTVYKRYEELEAGARLRLHQAVPAEARCWCRPREVVTRGKAHHEILRLAREHRAGLIVMGVFGRGAGDLLLFGSTTQHVVRAATCPILTIRSI